MIVIFDLATGAMVQDNVAALPEDFEAETFGWCEQPGRYPDDLTWSADFRGFIDARAATIPVRYFTFNQWVDLFSLEEQVAIVTATMSDPMAKLIYDRAQSASGSIDPTDPRTAQGLGYLVSKGYVEQSTFDRIVAS